MYKIFIIPLLLNLTVYTAEPLIEWSKDLSAIVDTGYKDVKINDFVEFEKGILLAVGEAKRKTDSISNAYALKINLADGSRVGDTLLTTPYANSIIKAAITGDHTLLLSGIALKDTTVLWISEKSSITIDSAYSIIVGKSFIPNKIGKFNGYLLAGGNTGLYGLNPLTDDSINEPDFQIQSMELNSSGELCCSGIGSNISLPGGSKTSGLAIYIINKEFTAYRLKKVAHAVAPDNYLKPPVHTSILSNNTFVCVGGNEEDYLFNDCQTGVLHCDSTGKELSYKIYTVNNYDKGFYVNDINDSVLLIGGKAGRYSNMTTGFVRKVVVGSSTSVWTKGIPGTSVITFVTGTSDSGIIAFDTKKIIKLSKDQPGNNNVRKNRFDSVSEQYKINKKCIVFKPSEDLVLIIYSIDGKVLFRRNLKKSEHFKLNMGDEIFQNKMVLVKIVGRTVCNTFTFTLL